MVAEAEPLIRIENVSKRYGDVLAVNNVSLDIRRGEFFALLGASGCGKTTLLRMLGGFETPTAGRILIDGADMSGVPPYERPVNMMFQSYALFPHMTVEQNIAFGLHQDRMPKAAIRERVREVLDLVQMGAFGRRKPAQLSGGQRQRVALARCLAKQPKVLLLDEPLAALDKKLREQTQLELVNIQHRVGITFIVVTHDQEEAMTMADRIGVMQDGVIRQVGSPVEIYEFPSTTFVADFIGTANMLAGTVVGGGAADLLVDCPDLQQTLVAVHDPPVAPGTAVVVMIRPEKMTIARQLPDAAPGGNSVRGRVSDVAYLGDMSVYHVELPNGRKLQVSQTNQRHGAAARLARDEAVTVAWSPADALVLLS
jgi:putrescine transport system ATP-binding protein